MEKNGDSRVKGQLPDFLEKAESKKEAFVSQLGKDTYYCVPTTVGNAIIIYGRRIKKETDIAAGEDLRTLLVLIPSRKEAYFRLPIIFPSSAAGEWKVRLFQELAEEKLEWLNREVIPEFFAQITPAELDEDMLRSCRLNARRIKVFGTPIESTERVSDYHFPSDLLIQELCGMVELKPFMMDMLRKYGLNLELMVRVSNGYWNIKKAISEETRRFLSDDSLLLSWEKGMSDVLSGLHAENITVYLTKGSVTMDAKMDPKRILCCMVNENALSYWGFKAKWKMKEIEKEMGRVFPADIAKIVFRGKIIYDRENYSPQMDVNQVNDPAHAAVSYGRGTLPTLMEGDVA